MKFLLDKHLIKDAADSMPYEQFISHLAHSTALGAILMAVTLLTAWFAPHPEGERIDPAEMILESSNVLFLCIGITGVMILVNNDLARAFAIGAAIALVRFRVKLEKVTASGLFFSLIVGMACGVDQVRVAWTITTVFAVLKTLMMAIAKLSTRLPKIQPSPTAQPNPTAPVLKHL